MKFFKKACSYILYHGLFSILYLVKFIFFYLRRIVKPKSYAVKTVNKRYKMYLDLRDQGISRALYLYGTRERDQVYVVRDIIKRGMKVLDIGANIGYYVLLEAGIVGDKGRVYAFEPHPDNVKMLKKNIELNNFSDRVESYQKGVSDRDGIMEFFVSPKSNLHTLNPVSFGSKNKVPFNGSIKIEIEDISKFLKAKRDIAFIRMDIEGHEVEVLNGLCGALDDIERFPSVLFETHFPKYDKSKHNMRNTLSRLFARGYAADTVISNNELTSPLRKRGYRPQKSVRTDGVHRGIYRDVTAGDALNFVCGTGGVRAVLLKHERSAS